MKIPFQDQHNKCLNGPVQAAGGETVGQVEGCLEHCHIYICGADTSVQGQLKKTIYVSSVLWLMAIATVLNNILLYKKELV